MGLSVFVVTQGKPPATPGDSYRFARYYGLEDALKIDQKLKSKTNESIQEFESYVIEFLNIIWYYPEELEMISTAQLGVIGVGIFQELAKHDQSSIFS